MFIVLALQEDEDFQKLANLTKDKKYNFELINKIFKEWNTNLNDKYTKHIDELNKIQKLINELETKLIKKEQNVEDIKNTINKIKEELENSKLSKFIILRFVQKVNRMLNRFSMALHQIKLYWLKTVTIPMLKSELELNQQKFKAVSFKKNFIAVFKKLTEYATKEIPLSQWIEKTVNFIKRLKIDENTKFFIFNGAKTLGNANKVLGIAGFALKAWTIALDYNFKQIDDKVMFLGKLKVYFPEYKDYIEDLIKKLTVARMFDALVLKQIYTYIDNATGSFVDMLDSANDMYALITLSSFLENRIGNKAVAGVGSLLSIANSLGQAYKTWTAADSMAYTSAAASTLAYKMINNNHLSAKQKVKWYAIFQTISNASLVSWYYYDGKIAEKGDNGFYILGNALDIGLSIVSNPSTLGLADAATKAVLNEQIVSTAWAVKHGIARFKLPGKHATYTAEDELIARYLIQNAHLRYIINGKFEKGLENKLQLNVLPSTLYKLPGNKRVLSIAVNKNKLSSLSLRLLGPVSGTYADDLVRLRNTSLSFVDWAYNDRFFNEYDKNPWGRTYILTQYDSNTIILNILLKDVVNRIEVLGWLSKANEDTKPYYTMIDLSNLNEVDITKLSSKYERINREIQALENNKKISLTDDLDRTNIDKIKKIYSYLIGQGYTIFNPVNQKIITDTDMPNYWLALKYSNRNFMSRVFFFDGKKLYYELHDELTGAVKKNDWDNYKSCEYPLTLNHPISEMIEKSNEFDKRVVNATGLKYYFPKLESSMSCYKDKLPFISDYKVIVKSKSSDIIKGYYNESLDSLYLDNSVEDVILEYNYDIQAPLVFKINNKYIDEYPNGLYQINKKYDEKTKINTLTLTLKRGFFKYIDDNLNIELTTEPGSGYEFVSFGHSILVEKSKDLTYPQPSKTVKLEYSTNNIPKALIASEVSGLNKDDISQVTWKNDKGDVIGTDNSLTLSNLSVGEHTYTLEVTDSNGDEFVYTVVISVSDKGNCSIQEVYRIDAYWTPRHLVDNNIAYLATNKGIKVVDIYKRKVISNLKIELVSDENKNIYPEAIKKVGNLLYIADGDGGLKIFDTDDYSFKSELILGSHAFGLDIYKNYAFIADGEEGLKIVDISNPDNPFLVSTYKDDGSGYCINVTINKNYAYLAYDKKVIILNVSNPSSPSFVSSISTKWAVDTTVLNNLLYIADGDAGIKIVNVSNKQKPKIIYSLKTNFAHHIELKDNYIFIADDESIKILDDKNYKIIKEIKKNQDNEKIMYITIKGKNIFVSNGQSFDVLKCSTLSDDTQGNEKQILEVKQAGQVINTDLSKVKTIKCSALNPGDTFTINGKEYKVVDNNSIRDIDKDNGDFVHICTSHVTYMKNLFNEAYSFNQPIGKWDTSNVTDMREMFSYASSFNQEISNWNTSNVTDMNSMFYKADNFNKPIDNWDTSNVIDMNSMFSRAKSFNQPIESWNTSNVGDMAGMFAEAKSFNQPIGNWDTSNVTDMNSMFYQASNFNKPISEWNTSKVKDMGLMFKEASSFNQPIGNWDTSKVTNMGGMFYHATNFNQNISSWCVKNISSKPYHFDKGAGFEGKDELQPKWGTCPK